MTKSRLVLGLSLGTLLAIPAMAQEAERDLPDSVGPSETVSVSISLVPPGGTAVAGLEDRPPIGWTVSNISDSGSFDVGSQSVKWGPFFDPSIPASVSYDVTTPVVHSGSACFQGTASFDGNDVTISGDICLAEPVPTLSFWGLAVLILAVAALGSLRLRTRA